MNSANIKSLACPIALMVILCPFGESYPVTPSLPGESGIHDIAQWYGGEEDEFWESDTLMVNGKVYSREALGLRSPAAALFLALLPGFIVHGLGHYYAGRTRTGTALLITEGSSFVLLYLAVGLSYGDRDSQDAAGPLAVGALFGFLGSWAYDVIGSPLVIRKDNRKILENLSMHPYYVPHGKDYGHLGVRLQIHF